MKRLLLAFTIALASLPASAQFQQFGLMLGGSTKLGNNNVGNDHFTFSNSVKEIFYSVDVEDYTRFKIKAGRITAPASFQQNNIRVDVAKADVDHVDGIVDYRFSEPFGSTGLFAGAGLFQQKANGQSDELQYGFTGGVNGDFPLSRRWGVVVEATYYWINFHYHPQYATLTGGLRISF